MCGGLRDSGVHQPPYLLPRLNRVKAVHTSGSEYSPGQDSGGEEDEPDEVEEDVKEA